MAGIEADTDVAACLIVHKCCSIPNRLHPQSKRPRWRTALQAVEIWRGLLTEGALAERLAPQCGKLLPGSGLGRDLDGLRAGVAASQVRASTTDSPEKVLEVGSLALTDRCPPFLPPGEGLPVIGLNAEGMGSAPIGRSPPFRHCLLSLPSASEYPQRSKTLMPGQGGTPALYPLEVVP